MTTTSWHVVEVEALPGFRLFVRFADGIQGEADMSRLVFSREAGVFGRLRDPAVFAQVEINHGAATWPGEIDLAPDAMHDEIATNGKWIL